MSASAIADAIVNKLTAASAFGAGGAATTYDILESTAGCCCVVEWTGLIDTEEGFGGGGFQSQWTFTIRGFSKDEGDPFATSKRVPAIVDKIITEVRADRTIDGTVDMITAIRGSRELPPAGFIEAGGQTWMELRVEIDADQETWT